MLLSLFANEIILLAKNIFVADYITSLQNNWEFLYSNNNNKNNKNKVNNNVNIIENEKKSMETSNNVNF